MRYLVSDFDYMTPQDDLHDINTGRYLHAEQYVSHLTRDMLQDGDMRVETQEINGSYKISRVVKKRPAEFLQGKDNHFVFSHDGKRIPLSEQQFDAMLGIEHNDEDVFTAAEVDLETMDSAHTAPMNRWDLVFDATDYIQQATQFIERCREGTARIPEGMTAAQVLEDMQDLIYSSNWFPYSADRRIHGPRAKAIAKMITERNLTKQQLGALIGGREVNQRRTVVAKMRSEAATLPPGPRKGKLLVQAQKVMSGVQNDMRSKGSQHDPICDSDRAKLWELWKRNQIAVHGSNQLPPWQFQNWYRNKVRKSLQHVIDEIVEKRDCLQITPEQAQAALTDLSQIIEKRVKIQVNRIYGGKRRQLFTPQVATLAEPAMPAWLNEAPAIEAVAQEDEFVHDPSWLQQDPSVFQDASEQLPDENEWMNAVIMSEGE